MRYFRTIMLSGSALALLSGAQAQAIEGVVASIKPIHSLVAGVMEGVGDPSIIVSGASSPHSYSMRPSEAKAIEDASLVFWVGPNLETFLQRPLDSLASNATVIELGETEGLTRLEFREGGPFEAHDHAHHDEDTSAENDHAHDHGEAADDHAAEESESEHSHDHGTEETAEHSHDHDAASDDEAAHDHSHEHEAAESEAAHDHAHDHDETHDHAHEHGTYDAHYWLDPQNAKVFVGVIEQALAQADPDNAEQYAQNAATLQSRLDTLITETQTRIDGIGDGSFIVFHDAYHYFENRFGIEASGSITVSPDQAPGAQRLSEIQEHVRSLGASCVFAEPQFEPRVVQVVTEGTDAKSGVLDPLGADLADGPDLYFQLIDNLTTSLSECLTSEG